MRNLLVATAAVALLASSVQAAMIENALELGENTINDTNVDVYIPAQGNDGSSFQVGDQFVSVLYFENISNSSFANTPLGTAVGAAGFYQLGAVSTLTIDAINDPSDITAPPGSVDLSLNGTVDIYETDDSANDLDFSNDTLTEATNKVTGGDLLLSFESDFFQQLGAPGSVAGITTTRQNADAGFSLTANPAGILIQPDGVDITYFDAFDTDAFITTNHDAIAFVQLFQNTGANAAEFPLLTDTTVSFSVIPEPTSVALCSMLACVGIILGVRRRRARLAA